MQGYPLRPSRIGSYSRKRINKHNTYFYEFNLNRIALCLNVRPEPCQFCPYRKDVPSGVWSKEDYEKLPPYDNETALQPHSTFQCHESPGCLCSGWVNTHEQRQGHELLSVRLLSMREGAIDLSKKCSIPLFESGTAAAKHGMKNFKKPCKKARTAMAVLAVKLNRRAINE